MLIQRYSTVKLRHTQSVFSTYRPTHPVNSWNRHLSADRRTDKQIYTHIALFLLILSIVHQFLNIFPCMFRMLCMLFSFFL